MSQAEPLLLPSRKARATCVQAAHIAERHVSIGARQALQAGLDANLLMDAGLPLRPMPGSFASTEPTSMPAWLTHVRISIAGAHAETAQRPQNDGQRDSVAGSNRGNAAWCETQDSASPHRAVDAPKRPAAIRKDT